MKDMDTNEKQTEKNETKRRNKVCLVVLAVAAAGFVRYYIGPWAVSQFAVMGASPVLKKVNLPSCHCPDGGHQWETFATSAPPEGYVLKWQRCSCLHCHATREILEPVFGNCRKCGKDLSIHERMGICRDCEREKKELTDALTPRPGEDSLASVRRYGAYLAKKKLLPPPCAGDKHEWEFFEEGKSGAVYRCRQCGSKQNKN